MPFGVCGVSGRAACVKHGDGRSNGTTYRSNLPGGCGTKTGMVFRSPSPPNTDYGAASPGAGVLLYVMRGTAPGRCDSRSRAPISTEPSS
jgi:hypothetical protein